MRTITEIKYVAIDGKIFSTEQECIKYEKNMLKITTALKKVRYFDYNDEELTMDTDTMITFYNNGLVQNFDENEIFVIKIDDSTTNDEINIINDFIKNKLPGLGNIIDLFNSTTKIIMWIENENRDGGGFISLNDKLRSLEEEIEIIKSKMIL